VAKEEAKVLCQTPTLGKKGTRIAKWTYDIVRATILKAVPDNETGVEFKRLPALVKKHLSADLFESDVELRCRGKYASGWGR
jgi:hypothetical protein